MEQLQNLVGYIEFLKVFKILYLQTLVGYYNMVWAGFSDPYLAKSSALL